jgi:hypothetical protein
MLLRKGSVKYGEKGGSRTAYNPAEPSPDFDKWPERWMGTREDREYGKKLLSYMEEFLDVLIKVKGNRSRKTLKIHIDNAWLLGGLIIRHVSMYEEYKTTPLKKLMESVESGGILPDGYDHMTERDQSAFESTCELFENYLKKTAPKKKSHTG